MNVYVRELVSALAQAGVTSDVYTRRWADGLPDVVDVEPGFRVVHVDAGPVDLPKEALPEVVDDFTSGVLDHLVTSDDDMGVDALHANYWLSGVAGHRLKHELDLPLVSTFHTLARVKAETGDPEPQRRIDAEASWPTARRRRPSSSGSTAPTRPGSRSSRRASSTPSSRLATGPGPAPRSRTSARSAGRCCCSSAASSR
jgi:hypothetical protein